MLFSMRLWAASPSRTACTNCDCTPDVAGKDRVFRQHHLTIASTTRSGRIGVAWILPKLGRT